MTTTIANPRVDAYLASSAEFARPIMTHLRELIHRRCPAVVEEIRWGIPHFDYAGDMMCVFAAHRAHCSFTFLKESIMSDPRLQQNPGLPAAKRYMGRLASLENLPRDGELIALIGEAMQLNEQGIKVAPRPPKPPAQLEIHPEFSQALADNAAAQAIFDKQSPSFRKEYLVWINDAKTEATRSKRIAESLEWIAEGKRRFWKYQKRT